MTLPWSEEEIINLEKLWTKDDVSDEDINRVFVSRSWDGIRRKAHSLGLGRRKRSVIDYDYLRSLGVVIEG